MSSIDFYKRTVIDLEKQGRVVDDLRFQSSRAIENLEVQRQREREIARGLEAGSPAQAAQLAKINQLNSQISEYETRVLDYNQQLERIESSIAQAERELSRVSGGGPTDPGDIAAQQAPDAPLADPSAARSESAALRADVPPIPTATTTTAPGDDPSASRADVGEVPGVTVRNRDVVDTGGVPTQSLADIDGDTGFVPQAPPAATDPGPGYGEEDDPLDIPDPDGRDIVTQPGQFDDFIAVYDVETGNYNVENLQTGETVATGLTENEARIEAQDRAFGDPAYRGTTQTDPADGQIIPEDASITDDVDPGPDYGGEDGPAAFSVDDPTTNSGVGVEVGAEQARAQAGLQAQQRFANYGDWRLRVSLAAGADYLYKVGESDRGILAPLFDTDGVIYPYTPTVSTVYAANYSPYDLTHSNYKGYWYRNSHVQEIQITGTFTAQDTLEADYLLAVIHFYRSVTKMFYGQDIQRGSPPPLCYLTGFGDYQFNGHPVVISQFQYNLPKEVDYIRAGSRNIDGTNLIQERRRESASSDFISPALNRLATARLPKGGFRSQPPAPPTLGLDRPTYVPTKMDITITCLPIQTRKQVSSQFSVKGFANGDLLRGGFW